MTASPRAAGNCRPTRTRPRPGQRTTRGRSNPLPGATTAPPRPLADEGLVRNGSGDHTVSSARIPEPTMVLAEAQPVRRPSALAESSTPGEKVGPAPTGAGSELRDTRRAWTPRAWHLAAPAPGTWVRPDRGWATRPKDWATGRQAAGCCRGSSSGDRPRLLARTVPQVPSAVRAPATRLRRIRACAPMAAPSGTRPHR